MFKACSIEILKTKRTIIRKLIWIFPILVAVVTSLFFASTVYVIQSIINQWSFIWINLFLALMIGLIDRHEENSTEYIPALFTYSSIISISNITWRVLWQS